MTFQEKRDAKIMQLKDALNAYVKVLSDPELCNPGFGKLNDCEKLFVSIRDDILRINNAERS